MKLFRIEGERYQLPLVEIFQKTEGLDIMLVEALKTCVFAFDGINGTQVEKGDVYELDNKQARQAIRYDKGTWFRRYKESVEETKSISDDELEPETPKTDASSGRKGKNKTSNRSKKTNKKD